MQLHFRLYPQYPQNNLVTYPSSVLPQKTPFLPFVVAITIQNTHKNISFQTVIPNLTQLIELIDPFITLLLSSIIRLIGIMIHTFFELNRVLRSLGWSHA